MVPIWILVVMFSMVGFIIIVGGALTAFWGEPVHDYLQNVTIVTSALILSIGNVSIRITNGGGNE